MRDILNGKIIHEGKWMNLTTEEEERWVKENIDLYRKARKKWGLDNQLIILIEECGELIHATTKYMREITNRDQIIEEIADVLIMIEQVACSLAIHRQVTRAKIDKIERLKERLKQDDKKKRLTRVNISSESSLS